MSLLSLCPIYIPVVHNNLAGWQSMPFIGIFFCLAVVSPFTWMICLNHIFDQCVFLFIHIYAYLLG